MFHEGEDWVDVSHPPHFLVGDQSSAFIPFCAFPTAVIAELRPNISFPICTSFQPTILDGQLCYKLQVNTTSGKGKKNELVLLLDYHEDLSMHYSYENEDDMDPVITLDLNFDAVESRQKNEAKIQINTLSSDMYFGEGTYKISVVKKMTAKSAFLEMPMKDRNCQLQPFEECRTKALLEKCQCSPCEIVAIKASRNCQLSIEHFYFIVRVETSAHQKEENASRKTLCRTSVVASTVRECMRISKKLRSTKCNLTSTA